ncbi:MAG: phospholipase A [Rhodanobacteraceae bacterium]
MTRRTGQRKRKRHHHAAAAIAILGGIACVGAAAQNLDPIDIRACTAIETDSQRLACYDRVTGHDTLPDAERQSANSAKSRAKQGSVFVTDAQQQKGRSRESDNHSLLDSRWELDPARKLGTLNIRGFKPVFAEPVFVTSRTNQTPQSPNPDNTVLAPLGLENHEAKFQISFKTKLAQGLFGEHGDVWVGYTQTSRWQVYNDKLSRPFRETDYEPEAMLLFDTDVPVFGWHLRMLGIGLNHQSNGRSNPLSRSWNRIIGRIGLERPGWTIMYRPWLRLPESARNDNNPDITDYMGRGDLQVIHEWRGQEFTLLMRHSLSEGRGAGRFTWSFPVSSGVRGYMEVFNGYGESLIDYNHNASYFGLGVTLLDWY